MKQLVTWAPQFNPTAQTLDFSAIPNFDINKLYAVINVSQNTPIYIPGTATYGATISGNILTLLFNTSSHNTFDTLNIYYETASGYENNTPLEYGGNLQLMQETLNQILVELKVLGYIMLELGSNRINSIVPDELQQIRNDINNPMNSTSTST